jgi:hypothetical protein
MFRQSAWLVLLFAAIPRLSAFGDNEKLAKLVKARFEAATKAYKAGVERSKMFGAGPDDMYLGILSKDILRAELEMNSKPEKRVAACHAHLVRMAAVEKDYKDRLDDGFMVGQHLILAMRSFRIEAEYLFQKEKTQQKAKKPK